MSQLPVVIHWYARWRTGKSFDFSADMVVAIRWAAVQFVLRARRHGVANAFNLGIVGGQLVVIYAS